MNTSASKITILSIDDTLGLICLHTKPSLLQRIRIALVYIKSKGYGPTFRAFITRLAKAAAFCLNPLQVSSDGYPTEITGRSLAQAWNNFNTIGCVSPQSGQGSADSFADNSSRKI